MNTIDIKLTYSEFTIIYQIDLVKLRANVISDIQGKVFLSSIDYTNLPDKVKRMVEAMRSEDWVSTRVLLIVILLNIALIVTGKLV